MAAMLKERAIAKLKKEIIDKNGLPVMSPTALKLACLEHDGYETPELNDKLFLHFKGFRTIENLAPYSALKTLFLESNGLGQISGLETCINLRSLYLQQNGITKIEGLDKLVNLKSLNLSQNRLVKVQNLQCLVQLETLNLGKNSLAGSDALAGLLECPTITNLDVTSNDLEDTSILEEVLTKMPVLSCVYLKGNGLVRKTKHYRKFMITNMPRLAYLDDRPVFEIERVASEAWAKGGAEAEREARQSYNQAQNDKDRQQRINFKKWKAERRATKAAEIALAKAEGRELPPPKCFVRYSAVTPEQQERDQDERRRLRYAEHRALASSSNGMAGESTATMVEEMGREFAKECGASFGENGELMGSGGSEVLRGDLGIVKRDHSFAEGYVELEEEEERERRNQLTQKKLKIARERERKKEEENKKTERAGGESKNEDTKMEGGDEEEEDEDEDEDEDSPWAAPPAPSTTSIAAPALPPAVSESVLSGSLKGKVALQSLVSTTEKEKSIEAVEDHLDNGRRKAVDDSVRMYRERAKANRLAAAAESSGEDQGTTAEVLERAATNMDAMRVLNVEYNSMTPEQKKVLDARIQEAEDEEDNYRSERAKMKAMGSRVTWQQKQEKQEDPTSHGDSEDEADEADENQESNGNGEEESSNGGWTSLADIHVQDSTRKNLFDFEAVAHDMSSFGDFDKDACRLRFALLSSNGGVAPKTKTKKKKMSSSSSSSSSFASSSSRHIAASSYHGETKRLPRSTPPTSTYTPWAPDRGQTSGRTSSTTISAPPPAANDTAFNSKVMRILPVTVDLNALPSMMDSEEEDSDDSGDEAMQTTDVEAMD